MIRPIKFRAWDKRNKRFTNSLTLFASLDNDGTLNNEYYIEIDQFTGLYDNSRNEIYENDILRRIHDSHSNYVVRFVDGCFVVYNDYGKWGTLAKYINVCNEFGIKTKVIGNIRQDPEDCMFVFQNGFEKAKSEGKINTANNYE